MNKNKKTLIGLLVLPFIALTVIGFYYKKDLKDFIYRNNKDNKEATAPKVIDKKNGEKQELTVKKVSKVEKKEYTVANPKNPRYFSLDKLNINKARVLSVGLKSNGEIGVPRNIYDVAWYNRSGRQDENKVIFLDGHSGGPNQLGIFKKLPTIGTGEIITLERGDGKISKYRIFENRKVYLDKFTSQDMAQLFTPQDNKETVVIITCTGNWMKSRRTFDQRAIVRAILQ